MKHVESLGQLRCRKSSWEADALEAGPSESGGSRAFGRPLWQHLFQTAGFDELRRLDEAGCLFEPICGFS